MSNKFFTDYFKFMQLGMESVNYEDLIKGNSWYFKNFESAQGSPLAESLFSIDGVESMLVQESTLTVTRVNKGPGDWLPMAKAIGTSMREKLESNENLISKMINSAKITE